MLEVARRMARGDLPRARRILSTLDDPSKRFQNRPAVAAFGLGVVADELAESDPAAARVLLDEAYAGLRKAANDEHDQVGVESAANLMAELLPAVERIEPDRVAERAWLAASVRKPASREPRTPEIERVVSLAMAISRYDRPLAAVIADPIVEILPDLLAGAVEPYGDGVATIARTLAAYDPRAVAPLLRALPNSARRRAESWTIPPAPQCGIADAPGRRGSPRSPAGAGRAKKAGREGDFAPSYHLDR